MRGHCITPSVPIAFYFFICKKVGYYAGNIKKAWNSNM
jgi:hypothetical protein